MLLDSPASLSKDDYYMKITSTFIDKYPHYYKSELFATFLEKQVPPDYITMNEKNETTEEDTMDSTDDDDLLPNTITDDLEKKNENDVYLNFSLPFMAICATAYTEGLNASIKSYCSMFGEVIPDYNSVTRKEYYRLIYEKFDLNTKEDFSIFAEKQREKEKYEIIKAFQKHLSLKI